MMDSCRMTFEGFMDSVFHGETLWYNVSSHTNINTKGFMMNDNDRIEISNMLGESMAIMSQALQALITKISTEAVKMSAELNGGTITDAQMEEMQNNLSAMSEEMFPKYIKVLSERHE